MRLRDWKISLFLLVPIGLLIILGIRDRYIYPYLSAQKLKSSEYVEEIKSKRGNYVNVEDKVVWRSRKLSVAPPKIAERVSDPRVLSADPNTWIDINLSTQTLCLHHGEVNCFLVSTGMPWTPTPTGTFHIWIKLTSTSMSGPGYYLPGVPWTMYFYKGYGVHGTYWHNNFGQQMSHGCVNMRTPEAQFVFERVSVGTRVVVHY